MYVFSDPRVLDMLQRTVTCYSRIGEFLTFETSADGLELSVTNSSQSVLGCVNIIRPLFSGPGEHKCLQVKARALDLVLRRLESQRITALKFLFRATRNNQEQMLVVFNCADGVTKEFVLPSLDTSLPNSTFEETGRESFSFECSPSVLRSASASCESTADEIQLMFRPTLISFLAQKRGGRANRKAGHMSTVDATKTSINPGLKTLIKLQFDSFSQISVLAPRQLDLKFKEFRTMLTFYHQMIGRNLMSAEFGGMSTTIPVVFTGKFQAFPSVSFVFKFLARATTPSNEPHSWIKVGVPSQQQQIQQQREVELIQNFISEQTNAVSSSDQRRKLRRIERPEARASSLSAGEGTDGSVEVVPLSPEPVHEPESVSEAPSSPYEIGFTQPYEEVRGLFD